MDIISKMILLQIPTSICNFRCHYCYLAQRETSYQGEQAKMQYSPEHVAKALSPDRMGGVCFINACADGETLLTKDIDKYFKALAESGHYLEIVTNMTVTPMIDRILSWDKELLKHVEFKCSFHYLELKKKGLLDTFAQNVNKAWKAGASASVELTPSDELIPFIDEVKDFSLKWFGALPHVTIARDDRTKEIKKLTSLTDEEYVKTWSSFGSDFWQYKMSIFGKKQTGFCYSGLWSITVNIANGNAFACYYNSMGNIFEDIEVPIPWKPIGECPIAHCYNGHAFLTLGVIPGATDIGYGDLRNRIRADGTEWLQPEFRDFLNTKLCRSNSSWSKLHCSYYIYKRKMQLSKALIPRAVRKIKRTLDRH